MLEKLGFNLFASYGTADYYSEHGVKVQPVEWPYSDGNGNGNRGNKSPPVARSNSHGNGIACDLSIADYLTQKKIDLVINLPLRQNRYIIIYCREYFSSKRVKFILLLGTHHSSLRVTSLVVLL